MMTMKNICFLILFTAISVFGQTSKWTQTFTTAAGAPVTSGTMQIVPYANTYPTGALSMTHLGDGVWTVTAADGEYKLYYNGSAVTKYDRFWIGENRTTQAADFVDSLEAGGNFANRANTILNTFDSNKLLPRHGVRDTTLTLDKIKHVLLENQSASTALDSFTVAYGQTFTDPKVIIDNKNPWNAYIKTVTTTSVTLGINNYGIGDSVKVDILVIEQ